MKIDYFPDMNFKQIIEDLAKNPKNNKNSLFIFDNSALSSNDSISIIKKIKNPEFKDINIINTYLMFQKNILSFFKNLNVFVVEETLIEYDKFIKITKKNIECLNNKSKPIEIFLNDPIIKKRKFACENLKRRYISPKTTRSKYNNKFVKRNEFLDDKLNSDEDLFFKRLSMFYRNILKVKKKMESSVLEDLDYLNINSLDDLCQRLVAYNNWLCVEKNERIFDEEKLMASAILLSKDYDVTIVTRDKGILNDVENLSGYNTYDFGEEYHQLISNAYFNLLLINEKDVCVNFIEFKGRLKRTPEKHKIII